MSRKAATTSDTKPIPKLADIEKFFANYKQENDAENEDDGEKIGPNGIMKLCADLQYDPSDVIIWPTLLIAYC
jgi:hypothetical protein